MIGRSDSVKGNPETLAKELSQDEDGNESDDTDGYIETVVRTEKRKVSQSVGRLTIGPWDWEKGQRIGNASI